MLTLLFYLGEIPYTVTCERVREIVPMVSLTPVSHAPDYFAGFFNYRGRLVPVIDLRRLIQKTPCRIRFSTRIVLSRYGGGDDPDALLGLMAERVTDTLRRPASDFKSPALRLEHAPYLGRVFLEEGRMIHHIDLDRLPDCLGFLPSDQESHPGGSPS